MKWRIAKKIYGARRGIKVSPLISRLCIEDGTRVPNDIVDPSEWPERWPWSWDTWERACRAYWKHRARRGRAKGDVLQRVSGDSLALPGIMRDMQLLR